MNLTDKEAINNFMKKVESLNSAIGEKDVLISSLQSELEDLKEQYQALQNSYSEKVRNLLFTGTRNPANIYLLKFNNRNTRKRCEIC